MSVVVLHAEDHGGIGRVGGSGILPRMGVGRTERWCTAEKISCMKVCSGELVMMEVRTSPEDVKGEEVEKWLVW